MLRLYAFNRYTGHFTQTVVAHPEDSSIIIKSVGALLVIGEYYMAWKGLFTPNTNMRHVRYRAIVIIEEDLFRVVGHRRVLLSFAQQ